MLFKRFVGCIYHSLRELCTTPQFAVLLVSRWTRNTLTFAVCRNVRKLEHCTQAKKYNQKNCNPSSCVAQRKKLTVACRRITNFPSCVAWRPLCHLIMACDRITNFPSYEARRLLSHSIMNRDQNTTLSSEVFHICVKHLHGAEQIRVDEAIEYNRTIVQSSKSGRGSIVLYNMTKSRRAQSSIQISTNDSHSNYGSIKRYERDISGTAGKNDDRSCSAPMISINADKTRAVKKTKSNRKRDREASRISVRRVTKLFRRKKYSSRLKNLMKHNFPSSSLIRNFCSNYKKCFFWCTSEHFYCKYVFFINKQKEKKIRVLHW